MKLLLDVVEDMRSLADSLQSVAAALDQSDPEDAAFPAPAPEMPPAPADPPPKAITLEEVRAVLAERSHDGYTDQVRGLLQKYGAEKLSGVAPKADRDRAKDKGGFVGGQLRDNRRKRENMACRSMLTEDVDHAAADFIQRFSDECRYAACWTPFFAQRLIRT